MAKANVSGRFEGIADSDDSISRSNMSLALLSSGTPWTDGLIPQDRISFDGYFRAQAPTLSILIRHRNCGRVPDLLLVNIEIDVDYSFVLIL